MSLYKVFGTLAVTAGCILGLLRVNEIIPSEKFTEVTSQTLLTLAILAGITFAITNFTTKRNKAADLNRR